MFASKIDRNLVWLVQEDEQNNEHAWLMKFTLNKNMANLMRSQENMFISFQNRNGEEILKTIWDGSFSYNPLRSQIMNVYLTKYNFDTRLKMTMISKDYGNNNDSTLKKNKELLSSSFMGSVAVKNLENYNAKSLKANVAYCEELNFFYDFNTVIYYNLELSCDQNLKDDQAKPQICLH